MQVLNTQLNQLDFSKQNKEINRLGKVIKRVPWFTITIMGKMKIMKI